MTTKLNGVTVPAAGQPGETTVESGAPLFAGRSEAVKSLGATVMKSFAEIPETVVEGDGPAAGPPEIPEAGKEDGTVLSQDGSERGKPGTEPEWNAEQAAWFAKMDAAKTPEEIAAAQAEQPEFSAEEVAWLNSQETGELPEGEDLIGDAELKGKLDAKTQARINARIGKEVAKTKAAQEALEAATAKLAETEAKLAQAGTVRPEAGSGPLAEIYDVTKLTALGREAETALDQAEDLLAQLEHEPGHVEAALKAARVALKDGDGQDDYSPEAMKRFLDGVKRNATRTLRDVPKRADYLKQADAYAGEAVKVLPELADPKSARRALFDDVLRQVPEIKRRPSWAREAAVYVLGLEAYQKLAGGATAGAKPGTVKRRPVPVTIPTARGVAPMARPAAAQRAEAAGDLAERALNGDKKARLKYIQGLVPKLR